MTNIPKEPARPELIFALVGAAGTRLTKLAAQIEKSLDQFGYQTTNIRLSDVLPRFSGWTEQGSSGEFERISHLQEMGNAFRSRLGDGAALARAGIARIREERAKLTGNADTPASNRAYVLRQLKHPDEVELLRETYGSNFLLVAGHAPEKIREDELANEMARIANRPGRESDYRGKACQIILDDEKQADDLGQNTRDTYPKADFFANLAKDWGELSVSRFVDLLFGHPFHTPLPDEYVLYLAHAASLRSSDDNRQVGAAIADVRFGNKKKNADVIAVGMNEVPRAGGGSYWQEDSVDARDQALALDKDQDRAKEIKTSALAELIERIRDDGLLNPTSSSSDASEIARVLLPKLNGTQFKDIGEFSRPVHAEMAALIDAARRGISVDGKTMYVTTFPCHNCGKHIIASGIRQVIYLEPYPKSRTKDLYREEIDLEAVEREEDHDLVRFFAYTGIAPRQYQRLFSMVKRGAKKGLPLKEWNSNKRSLSPVDIPAHSSFAYVRAEREALEGLPTKHYDWDKDTICPALT